jgi:hypothetical protein
VCVRENDFEFYLSQSERRNLFHKNQESGLENIKEEAAKIFF